MVIVRESRPRQQPAAALAFFLLRVVLRRHGNGGRSVDGARSVPAGRAPGPGPGAAPVFHAGLGAGFGWGGCCSRLAPSNFRPPNSPNGCARRSCPQPARMTPTAPAIEYTNSLGGVFLISVTALRATSRGCTLGFSGTLLLQAGGTAFGLRRGRRRQEAAACRFLSAEAVRSFRKNLGRGSAFGRFRPSPDRR